jgi:diacylglycerol kinase (ATP)
MQKKVLLVHNPSAGSEDHSAEELAEQIAGHHQVVGSISDVAELTEALIASVDLVVAAGGDGTVGAVAKAMCGSRVPMTILPKGTANNIARSFGLDREPGELVAAWNGGDVHGFDVPSVIIDGEPTRFFEAFGFGAFPRVMHAAQASKPADDAVAKLDRDRKVVRKVLGEAALEAYTVTVDGVNCSGRYLMVEVMNIPYLGPHLELAPRASATDGELDVVLLAAEHRDALLSHVAALREGDAESPLPSALPVVRARRVTIRNAGAPAHRDGEHVPRGDLELTVEIVVEPGCLRVLVPAQNSRGRAG